MSDPISAAFNALHQQNIIAARDAEIARLKDDVERLTKAGDAMAKYWDEWGTIEAQLVLEWHEAKEGKQP